MDAKEYLNQIKVYNIRIRQMQEELARLESIANNTTSGISPDKVQSSPDKSKREKAIVKMVDLKKKLTAMIIEQEEKRIDIVNKIHLLEHPKYIEVLYLRYVEGKRITDIADIMTKSNGEGYSIEHVSRLHGEALNAFRVIYHDSQIG